MFFILFILIIPVNFLDLSFLIYHFLRFFDFLIIGRQKSLTALAKETAFIQFHSVKTKSQRSVQHAETVAHRARKIYRRGFFEIARRTAYLADAVAEKDRLRDHLIIEHKIVGVFFERQIFDDFAAKSAKARVIFRELLTDQNDSARALKIC